MLCGAAAAQRQFGDSPPPPPPPPALAGLPRAAAAPTCQPQLAAPWAAPRCAAPALRRAQQQQQRRSAATMATAAETTGATAGQAAASCLTVQSLVAHASSSPAGVACTARCSPAGSTLPLAPARLAHCRCCPPPPRVSAGAAAPLQISRVPCLSDNYSWLLHDPASGATAVVDPAEAAPVVAALQAHGWTLTHILNSEAAVLAECTCWPQPLQSSHPHHPKHASPSPPLLQRTTTGTTWAATRR